MDKINIQEILPFVEMPSRYLGCEANSIKKDLDQVDLKFALAFPDLYEIGTSHFGMQILYTILNNQSNIAAERFFTPAPDMEKMLLEKELPLFSLESAVDMKAFDIIGFSLLYELNFTNILTMLNLSRIPFYAKERDETYPLVIAGGPCAFNPEPLADFFDAFVIGDGEEVIVEISNAYIEWKKNEDGNKETLLEQLSTIQGVYIPSFFRAQFKPADSKESVQYLEPLKPGYEKIRRAVLADISSAPLPLAPVVPFGKPVHDRLRLEIARGCSRGCRFCQAGMIYRPVRERSVDDLVSIAQNSMENTGYSDISLLSLSTGDYGNLAPLMESLLSISPNHCTAISLPSVRAGKLNAQLMKIIKSVKKTGFTIAPEAGTQRLRDVINKNISEEDIFNTVNSAFEQGWRNIKLYFMNGLPTETQEDLEGIVDLSRRLASLKINGKGKSKINVSFATFIPKAHTPFQRCAQILPERSLENLNFLKQQLHHPGIKLKWQNPWMSLLEGVWARGDRRLSKVLVSAWEKGCRLDGWSDMFKIDLWQEAFADHDIDPMFYTSRERHRDEPLPWDHIDCGISREFMEKEFDRAMARQTTQDCREHDCTGCGICDFKKIQPVLFPAIDTQAALKKQSDGELETSSAHPTGKRTPPPFSPKDASDNSEERFSKLTVYYARLGDARHFGHLELAKIIRRAIRRTGIKVKYSRGFNPSMKLSFDNPLPVGMQSEEEFFNIHVHISTDITSIVEKLNGALPRSITITRCLPAGSTGKKSRLGKAGERPESTAYRINLKNHSISQKAVDEFMSLSEYIVDKVNSKGIKRSNDLRKITEKIQFIDPLNPSSIEMVLIKDGDRTIRPAEILTQVLDIPEHVLLSADILKLKQDTDTTSC